MLKETIRELAKDNKLTYSEVERIFYSQFGFVAHIIKEDKDKEDRRSIKIPGFGSFIFSKRRAEILTKEKKRKDGEYRKKNDSETSEDGL